MPRFFPSLTASKLQATTYLLGIALFSIAFLVFLNSSISFVVTYVIGQHTHVGDAVGTLGFADELLALVACPLWGLLSDRVGVRAVAVTGYCVVGLSLICLVKSRNVYPELLLGRLGFSIGGAACSTMVTAVLPAMVAKRVEGDGEGETRRTGRPTGHARRIIDEDRPSRSSSNGHAPAPSVSSELTITPRRYNSQSQTRERQQASRKIYSSEETALQTRSRTSQLAGFVGMFTGLGALIALAVFLPLPTYLHDEGQEWSQSVQSSFYIVGAVSFCVAVFIFFGLRNLPGEEGKSLSNLWRSTYSPASKSDQEAADHPHGNTTTAPAGPSYIELIVEAIRLGLTDSDIGLGYLGGFVARASSVGISLFIPLFVNAYFIDTGLCAPTNDNPTDIKENCDRAYKLASALSGIAETAALICAPIFGWLGGRVMQGRSEWPLLGASVVGAVGYTMFGLLRNPDAFHGEGGQWAILAVILVGISQIGSIVCSLGLLSRGANDTDSTSPSAETAAEYAERPGTADTVRGVGGIGPVEGAETAPLLPSRAPDGPRDAMDRSYLKGSIAGIYSFAGGAGILLLTKLGGVLFDRWTPGAPFFILAIFNAVLLVAVVIIGGGKAVNRKQKRRVRDEGVQTVDN